jgi:hypothetical protein
MKKRNKYRERRRLAGSFTALRKLNFRNRLIKEPARRRRSRENT